LCVSTGPSEDRVIETGSTIGGRPGPGGPDFDSNDEASPGGGGKKKKKGQDSKRAAQFSKGREVGRVPKDKYVKSAGGRGKII